MTITTLTRLARLIDAQRKEYSDEREELWPVLAEQCRAEGYPSIAIRIAVVGGTAACEYHGITEVHGAAAPTN